MPPNWRIDVGKFFRPNFFPIDIESFSNCILFLCSLIPPLCCLDHQLIKCVVTIDSFYTEPQKTEINFFCLKSVKFLPEISNRNSDSKYSVVQTDSRKFIFGRTWADKYIILFPNTWIKIRKEYITNVILSMCKVVKNL